MRMAGRAIAAATVAAIMVTILGGCVPEARLDCDVKFTDAENTPTSELAVVIAPTSNFVNFSDAYDASRGRLAKLISESGTEVTTVLADGAPRQFSQTITDYSGTDTESDREDVVDASLASIRRLYRCVTEAPDGVFEVDPGSDMLAALSAAAAALDVAGAKHHIVVIGNGLQIGGQLPMQEIGLPKSFDNAKTLVRQLKSDGALPDLNGATVDVIGIGMADGSVQPTLNQQSRDILEALWHLIIEESNGVSGDFVAEIPADEPEANAIPTQNVDSVENACLFSIGAESGYEFKPDTASFIDEKQASDSASRIAENITSAGCSGTLVVTGYAASGVSKSEYADNEQRTIALSLRRAEAFEALLKRAGIANPIEAVGGGKGPFNDWNPDGSFNEKNGRKNRIVEITQK